MVVAVQTWELSLPGCTSLKDKRSVIRSLKDRLRRKFQASVAETDYQDVHERAALSFAVVATDRRFAESILDKADRFVQEHGQAVIVGVRRDLY